MCCDCGLLFTCLLKKYRLGLVVILVVKYDYCKYLIRYSLYLSLYHTQIQIGPNCNEVVGPDLGGH